MENWIYFVFISQGIWTFTSLIDKIVISKGYIKNPLVYIVLNGIMNILLIFLLPFVGFEPIRAADLLIGLLGGIVFSAGVSIYYKAVQYDEISRIVMLGQLGPVFVLVLSYLFLNEVLTANSFIGFLFLLIAGFAVSYRKVNGSFKISKSLGLMLVSIFLTSISLIIAKHIYNITSFWSAFLWLRVTGFTALLVLLLPSVRRDATRTFKAMNPRIKGLMIFKMVIDFSAFVFGGYALMKGPTSLVAALSSSLLPLFVFILALGVSIYFPSIIKEELDKKSILTKAAAVALVIIGIIFINI